MNIRGKNVEGRLRQFTSLKWNSIQNISKVHMQDHTDFGLLSKFRRPNQNLSNLDAIFVSKYDVTTASFPLCLRTAVPLHSRLMGPLN